MNLTEKAQVIFQANKDKGFHENHPYEERSTLLLLVISEISEAFEALRHDPPKHVEPDDMMWMDSCMDYGHKYTEFFPDRIKDTHEDEIADAIIRLLDYCGSFDIDIEAHIKHKLEYNKTRPYKHGKTV